MPRYLFLLAALLVGCSGSAGGPNRAPVAVAGPDRTVAMGESTLLDGTQSFDPDGDRLSYSWAVLAAPAGANTGAVLQPEPQEGLVRFTPMHLGTWLVALQVSDGRLVSERDLVFIRMTDVPCTSDSDCDDDGLYCNGTYSCIGGNCVHQPVDCDDGDICTQNLCDEDLDQCEHPPVTDPPATEGPVGDDTCSDGADNDCDGLTDTSDPACISCTGDGECVDLNTCTQDRCVAGACTNNPIADGSGCDDGQYCTENDNCQQGRCTGTPRDCSAQGGGCTTGACDDQQDQCVTAPVQDGTTCDDGLYCTENDVCTAGICSGTDRDCNSVAGDCADATCNDDTNQCEGVPKADGTPCEDGLYCTAGDQCQGGGCASGPQRDCGAAGGSCVDGTCNETADQCEGTTLPDGTACDDGDNCTFDDKCQGGACLGTQTSCSHLDGPCSSGLCNPSSGQCEAQAINQGQGCNDGQYCTEGDVCDQGSCTGTPRDCPHSLDGCAQGFCNTETQACDLNPQPDGTPCNDGDPCTFGDQCQSGACQPGAPCPLGCNTGSGRCNEMAPSNVGHDYLCLPGASIFSPSAGTTVNINTDDGTIDGSLVNTAQWVPQNGGARDILVLGFSYINIPQNTTINVSGSYPLALISCGNIDIHGLIDVSASQQGGGPGGYNGGDGNMDTYYASDGDGYGGGEGGAGRRETSWPYRDTSGGGGGFGRAGGSAGQSDPPGYSGWDGGAGGDENGTANLIPLIGGSGGGGAGARYYGAWGGGGGGAIQITAGGDLLIGADGGIRASGSGGGISEDYFWGGGGGGGAGGAILLEGATVTIQGRLTANGGGGGGARTDYSGWNIYCPGGRPTPGEDGPHESRRAAGGLACTADSDYPTGDGGRGGAQGNDNTLGEDGEEQWVGGGGGGAAGRIRMNSYQDGATDIAGSVISPSCTGTSQRCTTGAVSVW